MNIFVTDLDPVKSAQALDDRRLNKMITESVQLLANALHHHGAPESVIPLTVGGTQYRKTHYNHPCSIWTRQNRSNYKWLLDHTIGMVFEYEKRFGKNQHNVSNIDRLKEGAEFVEYGDMTSFANCSIHKDIKDVCEAYKMTMVKKWKADIEGANSSNRPHLLPRWTKSSKPAWYND